MTHALDAECHNSDRATQLNLLSSEELAEMQSPSAPRLRQGKMPPFKAAGGRKAHRTKDNATQPKLPGI